MRRMFVFKQRTAYEMRISDWSSHVCSSDLPIPGGAAAMVMLIGYSLARFQGDALFAGNHRRVLRPLATVLVPYYLIVAGYAAAWGAIPWASELGQASCRARGRPYV